VSQVKFSEYDSENYNIPCNVPLCNPSARIDDDKSVDSRFSVKIPDESVKNRLVDRTISRVKYAQMYG
jgi:hypothetical protein